MEGVHRLRELSLMSEEERCPWSSLPEVTAKKCAEHLSEEQLQSYQLLLDLVVGEVVYNQELSRLVDLARASVRWKDSLPLFNRRSIIACSLRVKKCSDALVRTLEEEWSKPQSLVTDLSRTFSILEASFDAKAAQTYVAYCDNLDDARTLFRRATQRESGLMSSVVSARCHIECALLPIQRLSQLRTVLERIRRILPADDGNQRLLQCQQLFVTISGIIELCYKVLTSLHGSSYLADIDNMLDFSNKLSTLRLRRHRSSGGQQREEVERDVSSRPRLPLPDEAGPDTCAQPQETCQETLSPEQTGNLYSPTPTLKPKTNGAVMPQEELNGSFNLIDLRSMENLLIETKVDSGSSLESGPSSSSGLGSPGGDYELIELKELTTKRWSGDGQLLQKSFEEQPLYQEYNETGKTLAEVDSPVQSKSIFYAYLDITDNVYEDVNDSVPTSPLQPLRTLWCETDEVVSSGILDKLTPSQIALQESKFEILTSEVSYLKSLNILITLFVESAELKEVIDCEDRRNLFSNILEVRKASEIFLFDLAGQWEEDFMLPDVCSVIKKHTQATFRVYIEYCSNQLRFHRTLQRLMLDSERFMPVLSLLEGLTACQGYSLQSFLMLPVQRVTRLPLLIQAIQRRVPVNTPEFATCRSALTQVNQLVHECNEGVRNNEQSEHLQALSQILQNDTKEREENKINSKTPNKSKKIKKRHSSLPWKIFSSSSMTSCDD
ncbi:rho guanine nucleotide exchange factor 16-like isoform X3 [Homalodisca vitripennis]|nr:rho guanine nucleotide exchange factor 16-like isoform X3 [Homalodisca vitripennis]